MLRLGSGRFRRDGRSLRNSHILVRANDPRHAHTADNDYGEELQKALKRRFLDCFYYKDERALTAGARFMEKLTGKIGQSRLGVILHSQSWLNSKYCQWEFEQMLRAQIEKRMEIIPVKRTKNDPDPPESIKGIQYVKPWLYDNRAEAVADKILADYRELQPIAPGA